MVSVTLVTIREELSRQSARAEALQEEQTRFGERTAINQCGCRGMGKTKEGAGIDWQAEARPL